MAQLPEGGQYRRAGVALLAGVVAGITLVLVIVVLTLAPFRFDLGAATTGSLAGLGCTPGQCVNVTIGFSGASTINPSGLGISVRPTNSSLVVNGTPGAALNLVYFSSLTPHWLGEIGPGDYTPMFEADIVNPGGLLVGSGGATSISSGAVLCLKGYDSPSSEQYELTLAYRGTEASVLVTIV